jgi:hypothetical protein
MTEQMHPESRPDKEEALAPNRESPPEETHHRPAAEWSGYSLAILDRFLDS